MHIFVVATDEENEESQVPSSYLISRSGFHLPPRFNFPFVFVFIYGKKNIYGSHHILTSHQRFINTRMRKMWQQNYRNWFFPFLLFLIFFYNKFSFLRVNSRPRDKYTLFIKYWHSSATFIQKKCENILFSSLAWRRFHSKKILAHDFLIILLWNTAQFLMVF
jgi:hypothetical protein